VFYALNMMYSRDATVINDKYKAWFHISGCFHVKHTVRKVVIYKQHDSVHV